MLLASEPSLNIVKMLLARDQEEMVVNILYHWASNVEHRKKMIDPLVNTMQRVNYTIYYYLAYFLS